MRIAPSCARKAVGRPWQRFTEDMVGSCIIPSDGPPAEHRLSPPILRASERLEA